MSLLAYGVACGVCVCVWYSICESISNPSFGCVVCTDLGPGFATGFTSLDLGRGKLRLWLTRLVWFMLMFPRSPLAGS